MKQPYTCKKLFFIILCVTFLFCASVPTSAASETAPVISHGLNILAAKTDMAVSVPAGNDMFFCSDDFARNLNLSHIDYITILSLPKNTEGELLLGSTRVAVGQTISAENLSYLSLAPLEDVEKASFEFAANGNSIAMVCRVYWMNEENNRPTVSMASGLSLNISSYQNLPTWGKLSAYDADGDQMVFEIVSYPKNGAVLLENQTDGSYCYTPNENFVGSDSFSYVARDLYGNYSAMATVNLKVSLLGTSVSYVDMQNSSAYNAALSLTEAGIMSGTQIGNEFYFYPEKEVSRAEFLVMAMNAVGITDVPECEKTVFFDDDDIPSSMKGYVATAYAMHYISGSTADGKLCFLPNEPITRAQAAVILSNIIGLCEVPVIPVFADKSEIPVWAREAIYSLHTVGILSADEGYISPTAKITREQTASVLSATKRYAEEIFSFAK